MMMARMIGDRCHGAASFMPARPRRQRSLR
jgi:hypothetical protein